MINKLLDFYFKYSPMFTDRYEKYDAKFLFSKFVDDMYSNIAIVDNSTNLNKIDKEFISKNLESTYYSLNKLDNNFYAVYEDDFLLLENIDTLYNKFKKFKNKNISLIEVVSTDLENEYMLINDKCYGEKSSDNPYSNLDNYGYCKTVLEYKKNESETKTLIYIIKYKNQNVGCINITIKNTLCYISGLAILKEFRKSKVFLSMVNILEILKNYNVNSVFCVTELDEYPDKLYKKLGFKSVGVVKGYKK